MKRSRPVSGTRSRLTSWGVSTRDHVRKGMWRTVRCSRYPHRRILRPSQLGSPEPGQTDSPIPAITNPRSPPNLRFNLNTIGLFEFKNPFPPFPPLLGGGSRRGGKRPPLGPPKRSYFARRVRLVCIGRGKARCRGSVRGRRHCGRSGRSVRCMVATGKTK